LKQTIGVMTEAKWNAGLCKWFHLQQNIESLFDAGKKTGFMPVGSERFPPETMTSGKTKRAADTTSMCIDSDKTTNQLYREQLQKFTLCMHIHLNVCSGLQPSTIISTTMTEPQMRLCNNICFSQIYQLMHIISISNPHLIMKFYTVPLALRASIMAIPCDKMRRLQNLFDAQRH